MSKKKYIAAAMAAVTLAGCGSSSSSKVYSTDEILSAVSYDISSYVKLPSLKNISTSVTGDYKVTDKDVIQYINLALKSTTGTKKMTYKTLTDAACKKYLGYSTVAKYKSSIKDSLKSNAKTQLNADKKTAVMNYLVSKSKIKVPAGLIDQMTETEIKQYKAYAKKQKTSYKTYIKNVYGYTSESKFKAYVRSQQKTTAKQDLVCQAVIKKTGLTVKKSDYNSFVKSYLKSYSMKEKEFYSTYGSKKKIVLIYAQNAAITNLLKTAKVKVIQKDA